MSLTASTPLVAELRGFLRFEHTRKLMACVGQVPGETSLGPEGRRDELPKAGADMAWAAHLRPSTRFRRRQARRLMKTMVVRRPHLQRCRQIFRASGCLPPGQAIPTLADAIEGRQQGQRTEHRGNAYRPETQCQWSLGPQHHER